MRQFMNRILIASAFLILVLMGQSRAQAPAAPKGFDSQRDSIERGKIESVEYDSKTVGAKRKMVIYTPPGYAKANKYPVLYLLHGAGDDETGWQQKGSADVILDNLYADKKLVPMIVVMPNGFARAPGDKSVKGGKGKGNSAFEADLLKDIIPFFESHYAVDAGREHRALPERFTKHSSSTPGQEFYKNSPIKRGRPGTCSTASISDIGLSSRPAVNFVLAK
jgi:poly(3-hydroxybutyrate) depolymerase